MAELSYILFHLGVVKLFYYLKANVRLKYIFTVLIVNFFILVVFYFWFERFDQSRRDLQCIVRILCASFSN